jgi:hypothetical protein
MLFVSIFSLIILLHCLPLSALKTIFFVYLFIFTFCSGLRINHVGVNPSWLWGEEFLVQKYRIPYTFNHWSIRQYMFKYINRSILSIFSSRFLNFLLELGFELRTLLLEPHLHSILLWLFWTWGMANYLPRLVSYLDPPDFSLSSS